VEQGIKKYIQEQCSGCLSDASGEDKMLLGHDIKYVVSFEKETDRRGYKTISDVLLSLHRDYVYLPDGLKIASKRLEKHVDIETACSILKIGARTLARIENLESTVPVGTVEFFERVLNEKF
jgi:hypothetical protein